MEGNSLMFPSILDYYFQDEAVESLFTYFAAHPHSVEQHNPIIAMPTGTGKSHVIAKFIRRVLSQWPNQRFIVLTHVKELIEQDSSKLAEAWPQAPIGIYSAGLRQRDTAMPIIFGGVASVVKCVGLFGHRDLLIIDECHLLSTDDATQYRLIINELRRINPYLKVIGLTATKYRMGQGLLTNGDNRIFTDVCFDLTGYEEFNKLIAEGYICPPIAVPTNIEIDVSNVRIQNGEYSASGLEKATDKILQAALIEMVNRAQNRHTWIVFTSGIETAENAAILLNQFGIRSVAIHSKKPSAFNDRAIREYKAGQFQALINFGKMTTGFDHPQIDHIGMLRKTLSVGLWVQMVGRGTRPCPSVGKLDCLVTDFAANSRTLGPINDPYIPKEKGKSSGDAPVRICPSCGAYNAARATFCMNPPCGVEFTFKPSFGRIASTTPIIKSDQPIVEYYQVFRVIYNLHIKTNKEGVQQSPPSILVTYFCGPLGMQIFKEWVSPEHPHIFAQKKFRDWWRQRHTVEPPQSTAEALNYVSQLRAPRSIRVHVNKQYPEIKGYEF